MIELTTECLPKDSELLAKHRLSKGDFAAILNLIGRTPTLAELGIFSAMWSEHCSYKSSRQFLKRLPTSGEHVLQGPGENAGVIRLKDRLAIAFKMESHNHPSFIEPYQGAATGVGGILRDVFCMGARPIANLNCLRFGTDAYASYLREACTSGIGDYGNCVGVPTVGGNVDVHPSYDGNCLVNAMTVGVIDSERIFRGYASGSGNWIVYVGSATGRDGIHGASMASDRFDGENQSRTTIQVGDPFMEKLLMEVTLAALEQNVVLGLQDMGAAGLTSSSFEMAARSESGLEIDLDLIPVRAANMSAYELLLSESQERMLMCVEPDKFPQLLSLCKKWQLSVAKIGEVASHSLVRMYRKGILEVELEVNSVVEKTPTIERSTHTIPKKQRNRKTFAEGLRDIKQSFVEKYDRHVGTRTILDSSHGGAAVLQLGEDFSGLMDEPNPFLGVVIATACDSSYVAADPERGAGEAVRKCFRMITAAGGVPLAVTDCLNFGDPNNCISEFAAAVDGISRACLELGTPVVSGNVSLYNESKHSAILPTPMIGMVGRIDDIRLARPARVMAPGVDIYLIEGDDDLEIGRLIRSLPCSVCRDIGSSGLAATIVKLAYPFGVCADIPLDRQVSDVAYIAASNRPISGGVLIANITEEKRWIFNGQQILDVENMMSHD